ncbi:hypothetical protein F2P45_09730 [Massilia sp. CCM 8733]|uniref:Uncharacterized protein n=1 Tax=Massilia mucilaginosa TaxID=2609282 RepID=A0ABX0NR70_9BURK|nr:hypothetical protein [Massilia mucilaginosa]NHZ89290.1 hypothetical protein [Massilia mucilaginosa]
MPDITNNTTIKLDTSKVEAGLKRIDEALARTGRNLDNLGDGDGMGKLGDDAQAAAAAVSEAAGTVADAAEKQGASMADLAGKLTEVTSASELCAEALLAVSAAAVPLPEQLTGAAQATSFLDGMLGKAKVSLIEFGASLLEKVSFGAMLEGINAAITGLADLDDMAQRTGTSVDTLSRMQKVAQMTGQDFGEVDRVLTRLAGNMGGVGEGADKVKDALARLGVSATDASGNLRDPAEVLIEASTKLQGYSESVAKTALQQDLLGTSGAKLTPYLNDVVEHIGKFSGTSEASAAAATAFAQNMAKLQVRLGELGTSVAENLLPQLVKLLEKVNELTDSEGFKSFVKGVGEAVGMVAGGVAILVSAIEPAAKIVAAFFGLFVAAPAAYGLVMAGLAALPGLLAAVPGMIAAVSAAVIINGGVWATLNTNLGGVSLSAQSASGWMGKLQIAAGVAFAAFAGWEIGTWLRNEFEIVRIAGLEFVRAILIGFENISFYSQQAFTLVKGAWSDALGNMSTSFGSFADWVAGGLDKMGAKGIASEVRAYANSLRSVSEQHHANAASARESAKAQVKAHEQILAGINGNIDGLVETERLGDKVVEATSGGKPKKVVPPKKGTNGKSGQPDDYDKLTASIHDRIAANELALKTDENASESQKLSLQLDQDLASGKVKLTEKQWALVQANLAELSVTERRLKLKVAEDDVLGYILQSTAARLASKDALAQEYSMYGRSSDARDLANVSVRSEIELQKILDQKRKVGIPVTDEMLGQMRLEKELRDEIETATLAQTKALGYASTLTSENQRFAAESIFDERERGAALLEIEADTWRERIALAGEGTDAQKKLQTQFDQWYKNQSAKPMIEEWKKSVQQYEDVFRKGFSDMLLNGKDGWKSFTKSLTSTFKTSVADQIYKMFIKPLVLQVVGNIVGGPGSGGTGGFDFSSAGQSIYKAFSAAASSGGGLANMGKTFFTTLRGTPAASNVVPGAGGAVTSGTTTGGGFSAAGGAMSIAGWIAAGMALSKSLYAKGWDAQNGSINSSGPVAPFNAPMLHLNKGLQKLGLDNTTANMLSGASTVSRLFGRKNPEVKDFGIEGKFDASGFDGKTYQDIVEKGGIFRKTKRYTRDGALDAASESTFDGTIKNLMTAVKGFGAQLGIEATQVDSYTKSIKLALTSDEAKNKELIVSLFGDIGNELATLLLPTIDGLSRDGETAAATLQRIATEFVAIDAALASVGDAFGAVGMGSLEARQRLLDLSGGMESFGKDIAFFGQNYLTEAERLAPVAKTVEAALASLGMSQIKTRDQFKEAILGTRDATGELVGGLDLTTLSGAKTYAGLMDIQEAFAQLHPAVEKVVKKLRTPDEIKAERDGLSDQIDELTMTPEAYRDKQRIKQRAIDAELIDPSNMDLFDKVQNGRIADEANQKTFAAKEALDKTNKAIQDQIDVYRKANMEVTEARAFEIAGMDETTVKLYDSLEAYKQTAAAADAVKSANKSIQDQIDVYRKASMEVSEARAFEIAGMDATTVKLYDSLAVYKQTADAADALKSANKVIQDQIDSILKSRMDPDELRAEETKDMKPKTIELYDTLAALKLEEQQAQAKREADAARAADEKRIAEEAQRAAEQLRDAWKSVTDAIFDEVKRLRGLIDDTSVNSVASAQSAFTIATAQARSGDMEAGKMLPTLSQKLIELTEANATSMLELQRVRAQTAASLAVTGALLSATMGVNPAQPGQGAAPYGPGGMPQPGAYQPPMQVPQNWGLQGGVGGNPDAQRLQAEVEALRAETRATATHTAKLVSMLSRLIVDDVLKTKETA